MFPTNLIVEDAYFTATFTEVIIDINNGVLNKSLKKKNMISVVKIALQYLCFVLIKCVCYHFYAIYTSADQSFNNNEEIVFPGGKPEIFCRIFLHADFNARGICINYSIAPYYINVQFSFVCKVYEMFMFIVVKECVIFASTIV